MRARRSRGAAALAALVALAARTAEAAAPARPLAEALHVEPNACFDAASLAPVLARWLERDVLDRRVDVEIAGQPESPDGLTLRVRRDGRIAGERHFPGLAAPCDEVRAAVGLAAALAVDAILLESRAVAPDAPVAPAPARPLRAPAPPRPLPRFSTALDVAALLGVLPSPAAALVPGFGVRAAPAVELRFSGILSSAGSVAFGGGTVGAALLAGRADGCGALDASLVRARACLGLAAGRLHTTTAQIAPSLSPSTPWAAAAGRVDLRVGLAPWLGLVLGGDALVPLTRARFEVVTPAGAPVATRSLPIAGGAVSLGPEILFR